MTANQCTIKPMTNIMTANQATEAYDALQAFVRKITIAVRDGAIKVVDSTDAFTPDDIEFALDYYLLFINRFEQDGGILTINLDIGDNEYVQYSVRTEDVDKLLNQ